MQIVKTNVVKIYEANSNGSEVIDSHPRLPIGLNFLLFLSASFGIARLNKGEHFLGNKFVLGL